MQGVVCTLHEGDDFGKLALVNDAPRAASIVLREDNCHFLRVDKEDFNRILRVSFHPPSAEAFTLTAKGVVALCWRKLFNAALKVLHCDGAPSNPSKFEMVALYNDLHQ